MRITIPGHITGLMQEFRVLSKRPPSLEGTALKLGPIQQMMTACRAQPFRVQQAKRVALFLSGVAVDAKQEPAIQMVAHMAVEALVPQLPPQQAFMSLVIRRTAKGALRKGAQRVHTEGVRRAVSNHMELHYRREAMAQNSSVTSPPAPPAQVQPVRQREPKRHRWVPGKASQRQVFC